MIQDPTYMLSETTVKEVQIEALGYDWGPGNRKITIYFDLPIRQTPDTYTLSLYGKKTIIDWHSRSPQLVEDIVDIASHSWISGGEGNGLIKGIELILIPHPDKPLTSPFTFYPDTFHNRENKVEYTLKIEYGNKTLELSLNTNQTLIYPEVESYEKNQFIYKDNHYGEVTINYALFSPQQQKTSPLIILFHGAGEGGKDPDVALLGNKVVSLNSPKIQSIFDGAYVLVPQSPDMWMNDGSGNYTKDGTSKYTETVNALIDKVLDENPLIDRKRIYIGGGSNGGYMTINMVLSNPERYAAAFPICAAYQASWLDEDKYRKLKKLPIWFVHCINDPVVSYKNTAEEIYNVLKNIGHDNVNISAIDSVTDESGLIFHKEGKPYEYNAHWSWIPVYNNSLIINNITIFEWLASQSLKY